ncbi:MAG: hypothetical protein AAF331_10600 [Pseudomonadota bacterium]
MAVPFGSSADCVQYNLAAYVYFSDELSKRSVKVPITETTALKFFYGKWLAECHAEKLLEEKGVLRSVADEIDLRRTKSTRDRQIQLVISEYLFDGNYDSIFLRSSSCVPEHIRQTCLGTITSR